MDVAKPKTRGMNGTTCGCLGVVAFLYAAVVFNVIVPHLGYSVQGASHLLAFTALTGLASVTYLQCVYSDPGRVPPGWQPDAEQQTGATVLQVKRRGGGSRFCKKCQAYKPPRTHHCRRCGRCVLRMDHHCVWVNNCIGHGNYRAFLLMCMYLAAAALHALALLLRMDAHLVQVALGWDEQTRLLQAAGSGAAEVPGGASSGAAAADAQRGANASSSSSSSSKAGWEGPFWLHAAMQVAATALALPISAGLAVLVVWNGMLFLRNQTTIEYHEGVTAQYMAAGRSSGAGGSRTGHPFDLGWHDNLQAVCGESAACWALPGRAAAEGDGLSFPTSWVQQQGQQRRHGGQQGQQKEGAEPADTPLTAPPQLVQPRP